MANGRFDFSFIEDPCYLRRTVTLHTESKNLFYRFRRFFIDDPLLLVIGAFQITERRNSTQVFSRIAFGTEYRADLLARVLSVPLVDDITEWGKIVVDLTFTVHAVIDCDKSDARFGKGYLGIHADFQIIPAEP